MFGSLGNLGGMLQRARQLSGQVDELTRDLKERRAVGSTGGGLVTVEVNGVQEIVGCRIDPSLFAEHDAEFVEDLIVGAANQALAKSRQMQVDAMKSLAGGIDISAMREVMNKLNPGDASKGPDDSSSGP
ncbi:MAG TPA: YbaB/EbfC family nucleoid-associated protein [Pirellulales bacterium]|nr:YbaB/EbfC family nucleoid-associated protein [Pirellulales bacterium]